jgi:hypothetical protein
MAGLRAIVEGTGLFHSLRMALASRYCGLLMSLL